ncbi:uncharacterized protein [Rhodnius prolixus]|uniref:Uncharacterized protein n=1 Tax=Rhodnius prolixus TaxID=13249 RepID=T1HX68_RHOPR
MTVLASCLMICLLLASPCVKAESESSSMMMSEEMTEMIEDTSEERKKAEAMTQMYMAFMMFKTFISTIMMIISPIIQIKSFGLSVIGTLINAGRFLMQLKQYKDSQNKKNVIPPSADTWSSYKTITVAPYNFWPTPAPDSYKTVN